MVLSLNSISVQYYYILSVYVIVKKINEVISSAGFVQSV